MAELTITHRIEAPELVAAIAHLADALSGVKLKETAPGAAVPAYDTAAAPVVTTPVQAAPVQTTPVTVVPPQAAPVQTATPPTKVYTLNELIAAGGYVLDTWPEKQMELVAALQSLGANALTELRPTTYPVMAEKLRAMGANI